VEQGKRLRFRQADLTVLWTVEGYFNESVGTKLLHQTINPLHEILVLELARSEVEDIGADVAYGAVEVEDCLFDTGGGGSRGLLQQQPGVFQRQSDGIYGLNNSVMEIHTNAVAFFENGEPATLHIKTNILDGSSHPGCDGVGELDIRFFQRLRVAGCHTQHPHNTPPSFHWDDRQLMQTTQPALRVEISVLVFSNIKDYRRIAPGDPSDGAFTNGKLGSFPQAFDSLAMVNEQIEVFVVFIDQENLPNFKTQVILKLAQPFIQNFLYLGARCQR